MDEYADWPIYKIKLGTPDDLKIVRELRRHTSAVFRVDANCAWTADEAIANAQELKELGVEFIEQPLAADDWEGMCRLFRSRLCRSSPMKAARPKQTWSAAGDAFTGSTSS